MDFKILLATFGAVFLAELGDKTQLATFCLAANKCPWSVFAGSAIALVLSSLIAVTIGSHLSQYVPPQYIKRGAAILFLVMGAIMLYSSFGASAAEGPTC